MSLTTTAAIKSYLQAKIAIAYDNKRAKEEAYAAIDKAWRDAGIDEEDERTTLLREFKEEGVTLVVLQRWIGGGAWENVSETKMQGLRRILKELQAKRALPVEYFDLSPAPEPTETLLVDTGLPSRILTALEGEGITTREQLAEQTDESLLAISQIAAKSLALIDAVLIGEPADAVRELAARMEAQERCRKPDLRQSHKRREV